MMSHMRKAARRNDVLIDDCYNISSETDLEKDHLREERKISLHQAIKRLKPEYQQVLYLTYFEDFSNIETAHIIGKSKKQVENLLYNARRSLRSELEKEGFDYEGL